MSVVDMSTTAWLIWLGRRDTVALGNFLTGLGRPVQLESDSEVLVDHPPAAVATVTKVLWGKIAPGSDIELRQLGFPGVVGNMSKIIESSAEYLVFLAPSTGADDAAPNRYLVAGDVGLYELRGDQYVLRGGDVPPDGRSTLPANLDAATAKARMTS